MTDIEKMQLADLIVRNSNEASRKAFQQLVDDNVQRLFAGDLWPRATADALLEVAEAVIERPRGARGWHEE